MGNEYKFGGEHFNYCTCPVLQKKWVVSTGIIAYARIAKRWVVSTGITACARSAKRWVGNTGTGVRAVFVRS